MRRKKNRKGSDIARYGCTLISSVYCEKHQIPHMEFVDDKTTACQLCIEELIIENEVKLAVIFDNLEGNLPEEEYNRLRGWIYLISDITKDYLYICLLRALATKALRLKTTIEEIVKQLVQAKSVDSILPKDF